MKYLFSILCIFAYIQPNNAQTYEIGLIAGAANYVGDIGKTTYIAPNDIAIGAIAKWNRSKRHAFRASLLYAEVNGNDSDGDNRRKARGLDFNNTITELSVGMEYNFWEWYLYNDEPQFVPYLYTGITAFGYRSLYRNATNAIITDKEAFNFAIPMVIGIKKTLGRNFVIGAELGARYTFTDNIDGSAPTNNNGTAFGNSNTNDWYIFTGVTLSYTWGKVPCFCIF